MTAPADRRAMIAKIHIARKDLALTDDTYRAVLTRVTGHDSSADCADPQLHAVLAEFKRLGWQGAAQGGRRKASGKSWVRKVWAIWGDLKPLLDGATDDTLRTFVRRQTKSRKNPDGIGDPEWLSPRDATAVIKGLEGWLARTRAARADHSADASKMVRDGQEPREHAHDRDA